jgi:methylenetetrahydrofolate reductase (NADPH)
MKVDSRLAKQLSDKDSVVTVGFEPHAGTGAAAIERLAASIGDKVAAVNVSDNHHGIAMSSLAASLVLMRNGKEPVLQMVTRDRNRIALVSDLLGAVALGIKNVLCLSGYHQSLIGCGASANVFDIDSIQLIATLKMMNEGSLPGGGKIDGGFSVLIGAVANPCLTPLELNVIRLAKKVIAGADFIQTQPVFDLTSFSKWLEAVRAEGITEKAAILAGVMPIASAEEAANLVKAHTDFVIPGGVIDRIAAAGDAAAQKKAGIAVCAETVKQLRALPGLRGVHILPGSDQSLASEVLRAID